jgi:hypothetical protein
MSDATAIGRCSYGYTGRWLFDKIHNNGTWTQHWQCLNCGREWEVRWPIPMETPR